MTGNEPSKKTNALLAPAILFILLAASIIAPKGIFGTSDVNLVPSPNENQSGLSISPNGHEIAFSSWNSTIDNVCLVTDPLRGCIRGATTQISHIWIMNSDGSGRRQLTTGNMGQFHPVFSPDGTRILYLRSEYNISTDIFETYLWIMYKDGTAQEKLAKAFFGSFSEDGTKILYGDRDYHYNCTIWSMDVDGGSKAHLVDGFDIRNAFYVDHGSKMIFFNYSQISVLDLGTGQTVVVAELPGPTYRQIAGAEIIRFDEVLPTPDPERIMFSGPDSCWEGYCPGNGIFTIGIDGTGVTFHGRGGDNIVYISNDNILFVKNHAKKDDLVVFNLTSGKTHVLLEVSPPKNINAHDLSPDGKKIFFQVGTQCCSESGDIRWLPNPYR